MRMTRLFDKASGDIVFLFFLICPTLVLAAPNYIASEIPMSQDVELPFFADMDGDNKLDVLLGHWSAHEGRELYIYLQQSDGRFSSEPSRRVEIKPEIIAVTTAELGGNPGDELIFVTSDGVYSFSSAIESYSGNVSKLIDWPLIASTPHRKEVIYLGELPDINNDGYVDMLLPYSEGMGVFLGTEDNLFVLTSEVKTIGENYASLNRGGLIRSDQRPADLLDDEGNIVINIPVQTSSQFGLFLQQWDPDNTEASGSLLSTNTWVPEATLASISNKDKPDLLYLIEEEDKPDQLNLLSQLDDGSFQKKLTWQTLVNAEGRLRLVDFTGDGLDDMIRIASRNNDSDVLFYKNTGGTFMFDAPNQVMRFSGFDLRIEFNDLNNDNKPELNVSYYTVPAMDVLRDVRVQRTRLLFENNENTKNNEKESTEQNEDQIFNRRPDYKLEEKFSADSILAISALANLNNDINEDQQNDYIHVAADGTLQAKTISSENLQINSEAFWQYVPDHTILDFSVKELNGDSNPDLILYHSLHFTILISTQ